MPAAFDGDQKACEKHVLRLRSNFDEVTEKLEVLSVPEEFQSDTYEVRLDLVKKYNQSVSRDSMAPEYLRNIKERLTEADRKFRGEITGKLKKTFYNKQARLKAIRTDRSWSWIGELYPAVFTDNHQALLTSISKFMKRNSCFVEPSYEFLEADFLDGALIFIDEFDATKAAMQEAIIEEALRLAKSIFLCSGRYYGDWIPDICQVP